MLSVLTWKWKATAMLIEGNRRARRRRVEYGVEHVNRLRAMLARHLHAPHRVICITDDAAGLHEDIECLPMPSGDEAYYRCTRRLRMFAKAMRDTLGERALHLDLDTVIVDDITALAMREEPVVVWWSTSNQTKALGLDRACNPSFVVFTPGVLDDLWSAFSADPEGVLAAADRRGWHRANSDQCILSDWLQEHPEIPVAKIGESDGLYSFRDHILPAGTLPADARLVGFYDKYDPSMPELQAAHPWIMEHWRC